MYGTVDDANTYFETRLYVEGWTDATSSDKGKALAEATNRIDRLQFSGLRVASDQDNDFPRYYGDDPDGTEVVPDDIKIAAYEVAFALLENEVNTDEDMTITSRRFADVSTSYDRTVAQEYLAAGIPSAYAWKFLRPYLSRGRTIRLTRTS